MINLERLNQAIAIMERAGIVSMSGEFQTGDELYYTEEEVLSFGNSACFAGWVAVSPEFHKAGGSPDYDGSPAFPHQCVSASKAVATWLETDNSQAVDLLIYGEAWGVDELLLNVLENHGIAYYRTSNGHCTNLENWGDYTAQDVIRYLNALKALADDKN